MERVLSVRGVLLSVKNELTEAQLKQVLRLWKVEPIIPHDLRRPFGIESKADKAFGEATQQMQF